MTRLFLLAFLFAVQSLCFAHQVEHIALPDSGACAVCVSGANLGHAVVDSSPEPVALTSRVTFTRDSTNDVAARALPARCARAPPLFTMD